MVVSSLESGRIAELGIGLEVLTFEDAGIDALLKQGLDSYALDRELYLGACKQLGLESATTPAGFPLGHADHLRANGIELAADQRFFDERRRVKNEQELAGHQPRQKAAEAGIDVGVELLRRARARTAADARR